MVEDRNDISVCYAIEPNDPDIKNLLAGAREQLFQSKITLGYLAKMTLLGVNEIEEVDMGDFAKRIDEIKTYLRSHFPTVKLGILSKCYAQTPEPSTITRYRHTGPWLAKPVQQRLSMPLEISLNQLIIELFQARKPSVRNQ